jgi:hypothetical protein
MRLLVSQVTWLSRFPYILFVYHGNVQCRLKPKTATQEFLLFMFTQVLLPLELLLIVFAAALLLQ